MDQQKIILTRRLLFSLIALLIAVVIIYFFIWLYTPELYIKGEDADLSQAEANSSEAIEVFGYDMGKRLILEEYSRNVYIQLINSVITSAKAGYEYDYGYKMPGIFASIMSNMTDGLHMDAGNPITYLNFAYAAFSQYDPAFIASMNKDSSNQGGVLPSIKEFDEAPEGALYFTEEDEFNAEGLFSKPLTPKGQAGQMYEDNVEKPGKIEIVDKSPQILIYHSHATESYMPNTAGNYHTLTEKYNVVSVGGILAKNLQDKYKYKVLHDKTYHDKESYAYSYSNSLEMIKKYLNKYNSIKVILDIHRDAFNTEKLTEAQKKVKKDEYTAIINGKKAARIMLVIGGGNPNYKELEKFAVYIKKKMDKLYPGLFMKITVHNTYKYNQYFSNHSMLVEVGCMLNTSEEAAYSAQLLSRVLDEVIKDLKE